METCGTRTQWQDCPQHTQGDMLREAQWPLQTGSGAPAAAVPPAPQRVWDQLPRSPSCVPGTGWGRALAPTPREAWNPAPVCHSGNVSHRPPAPGPSGWPCGKQPPRPLGTQPVPRETPHPASSCSNERDAGSHTEKPHVPAISSLCMSSPRAGTGMLTSRGRHEATAA